MIDVVVLDDSALIRSLLGEIIGAQPDMRVVGMAGDPYKGREIIKAQNPHVLTLDIEMPRMNGLDFLERLMWLRPMPVVMISSMTASGTEASLRALELGAVDIVAKPALGIRDGVLALEAEIVQKIRVAAQATVRPLDPRHLKERAGRRKGMPDRPARIVPAGSTEKLIIIGASTGGTEAITRVLMEMPPDAPAIVIAQHMPPVFTRSFAQRLDAICAVAVREARDGERLLPGHAYIAPGDHHLRVARYGANYVASVSQDDPVNLHRPSVDVLFDSAARMAGASAVGIIMTGMGADGARGMRAMYDAGAATMAQDEASCVVFGMPKAAINAGGVGAIVPLERIAEMALRRIASLGPRAIRL